MNKHNCMTTKEKRVAGVKERRKWQSIYRKVSKTALVEDPGQTLPVRCPPLFFCHPVKRPQLKYHMRSKPLPRPPVKRLPIRCWNAGLARRTFPILRQTANWMNDYLAVKPSAIGQPTWPTQPSIRQGSVNE